MFHSASPADYVHVYHSLSPAVVSVGWTPAARMLRRPDHFNVSQQDPAPHGVTTPPGAQIATSMPLKSAG